jgi:CHASE2 domain-containing sensor protein
MARRRKRSRVGLSTVILAVVVILLGGAVVASAGWGPVFVAVAVVLVLAGLSSRRSGRSRRRSRR